MQDNGKEDARQMRERGRSEKGGGGRIDERGRIHDTNSFDVEK